MTNRFDNSEKNIPKDRNTKAYNNMMVYLRELKLHNEKCNDMVEQIYEQSKENNNKLTELQNIHNNTTELQNIRNDIAGLQDIRDDIAGLQDIRDNIAGLQDIRDNIAGLQDIRDDITQLHDTQQKMKETDEVNVRVLKKEIAVNNSKLDESLQNQITDLYGKIDKTKKTLLIYMRIIIWVMLVILLVLIIQMLPIF